MGDDNEIKKSDDETENRFSTAAAVIDDDDVSQDLFARLLIKRIVGFLQQKPSDFAITILPSPSPDVVGKESEEERDKLSSVICVSPACESLSTKQRVLLETSVVLMHDFEGGTGCGHLGLEARNLPMIARVLRKAYRRARQLAQNVAPTSISSAEKEALFRVTSCLLLLQPDHATAWADRRRWLSRQHDNIQSLNSSAFDFPNGDEDGDEHDEKFVEQASTSSWFQELDYLDILVTQHSKAPSYWAHRKYVLRHILRGAEASYKIHGKQDRINKTKEIYFAREIKTCIDVAEKYPKNYYAWTHRRSMWDLFSFDFNGASPGKEQRRRRQQQRQLYMQLLETELIIGMWQEWLPKHPADHSAVHYSCQVLDLLLLEILLQSGNDEHELEAKIESVSFAALEQVRALLSKFSYENESLWILRRVTYKILWKRFCSPLTVEGNTTSTNTNFKFVYKLVREDLEAVLEAVLKTNLITDIEHEQESDCCDGSVPSSVPDRTNRISIHAWTFLAWCMENLKGLDDRRIW
eukprot:CAMPEP_0201127132 /NCGR_PEP_ID=MMETSP0850-20130426/28909_1 /ASSEMBLY_ACC=CAM_ASM_000622 /TAXON_ID=183588 /ORGANISM="Pseudo-nitzschia fraudulenta, Strain WWA7" /LENGTH=523 /DNA_ID=CAMNT_0047395859 /DNA_START=103 /DNA_END=1671 /DNA_ORIENTATION=-